MIAQPKNPGTLMEAVRHFDSETARRFVESIKWADGVYCPKCGSVNVGEIKSRNGMKQCREKGCRKQFSLIHGTIMEGSHLTLDKWCIAAWMIVCCRNGVSSCEIARHLGIKQQSAWHLLHRVRLLMQQDTNMTVSGFVEADSTMVGGILKNMTAERAQRAYDRGRWGKTVVHAVRERRSGRVIASILDPDQEQPVRDFIAENVEPGTMVYTDKGAEFKWLNKSRVFGHESVNHAAKEYVRGECHTNGLESFWNCLRRGLKGTYVSTSPEHLQSYVDEQVWRYNNRLDSEWERFGRVMGLIVGKRLTYETLTDGATR